MHPDHVSGLASVLFSAYLPGRTPTSEKFRPWSVSPESLWYRRALRYPDAPVASRDGKYPPVRLHLPTEAVDAIGTYLPAVYLAPEILPFDLELSGLSEGIVHKDETIRVRALSNTHLSANRSYKELPSLYPHVALESYSFSFEVAGKTVVYSGDITALDELNPLLGDADIVIVEVAHFEPEELQPALENLPSEKIVLTHIHPGLEERASEVVRHWGDKRVSLASDGFRISLDAR